MRTLQIPITEWTRWFALMPVTTQTMFIRRRRWLCYVERRVLIETRLSKAGDAMVQRAIIEYRDLTRGK